MATPSIPRATYRCLRATTSSWQSTATRIVPRRSFHTPTSPPLCLDFLAPSWTAQSRSRHTQPAKSPRIPQRRTLTSTPHRRAVVAIQNPRKDDSGNDRTINISPRAAHRLEAIASTDSNPDFALRVSVESGGCHGFQYLMSLTDLKEVDAAEDTVFENEEVVGGKGEYKAKVVMDEASLELLGGSTVDYTMELIGSQFKVTGIPGATSSCGCGSSFDVAA